ncbi:hypothetical protein AVEN_213452-1, partial [Araneus ventricosus]
MNNWGEGTSPICCEGTPAPLIYLGKAVITFSKAKTGFSSGAMQACLYKPVSPSLLYLMMMYLILISVPYE